MFLKMATSAEFDESAECAIATTYKLTQFTDKFGSCLDKPCRNEKLLSAADKSHRNA